MASTQHGLRDRAIINQHIVFTAREVESAKHHVVDLVV
jgi:hypothetical protein